MGVSISGYYFGEMTAGEAEKNLLLPGNEHGSFVIHDFKEQRILSWRYGNVIQHTFLYKSEDGGFYIDKQKVFPTLEKLVDNYSKNLCIEKTTADGLSGNARDKWEIDRNSLNLRSESKLGEGKFGIVYEGLHDNIKVAIKTLKEGTMNTTDFIEEAQIMKSLEHPNLLKLYGVCSREEPIFIVTEFMKHGSLLKYLEGKANTLEIPKLLDMAVQISAGMAYLESRNYIHRDLAARNVLVGENVIMKIADFGLARFIKDDEYVARTGSVFPVKWTSPEAAIQNIFSSKSDVWSFGILLTELVTFGEVPYPDLTPNQVLRKIESGYRMKCPSGCPPVLYDIMLETWEADPAKRPTFKLLHDMLRELSTKESKSSTCF